MPYCVNVVVDIKSIYLNKRYLFQNKIYYLDKIYFCFAKIKLSKHTLYIDFMEHNRNTRHVLGWSIKKCGSFLKYVVLVSKTVAYIYNKQKCSLLQCLQTAKSLAFGRISETILQQLLANPFGSWRCSLFSL